MIKIIWIVLCPLMFLGFGNDGINEIKVDERINVATNNTPFDQKIDLEKFLMFYNSVKQLDNNNFLYGSPERKKF